MTMLQGTVSRWCWLVWRLTASTRCGCGPWTGTAGASSHSPSSSTHPVSTVQYTTVHYSAVPVPYSHHMLYDTWTQPSICFPFLPNQTPCFMQLMNISRQLWSNQSEWNWAKVNGIWMPSLHLPICKKYIPYHPCMNLSCSSLECPHPPFCLVVDLFIPA